MIEEIHLGILGYRILMYMLTWIFTYICIVIYGNEGVIGYFILQPTNYISMNRHDIDNRTLLLQF